MPLKKGTSQKTISANIAELSKTTPGKSRMKGIRTLAKNRGISEKKAQNLQAQAIAYSKAGKSR